MKHLPWILAVLVLAACKSAGPPEGTPIVELGALGKGGSKKKPAIIKIPALWSFIDIRSFASVDPWTFPIGRSSRTPSIRFPLVGLVRQDRLSNRQSGGRGEAVSGL